MPNNESGPSQVETIRILASIQTTNEFILKGMTELKTEMGKVGEVVQAHAILLQGHGADILLAKHYSEEAHSKAEQLALRVVVLEAQPLPKSQWSIDNVKVVMIIGSAIYLALEIGRTLINAALHPSTGLLK